MAEEGRYAGRRERLLFVCSGNTCRSPLAEALVVRWLRDHDREDDAEVRSAGIYAGEGAPASPGARRVAEEHGLSLARHTSRRLTPELAEWADRILCMSETHLSALERMGAGEKTSLATRWLPDGHPERGAAVADPMGWDVEAYRRSCRLLEDVVDGLMREILPEEAS